MVAAARIEAWIMEGPLSPEPYKVTVREGAGTTFTLAGSGAYVGATFRSWISTIQSQMIAAIGSPATCGIDANGLFFFSNNTSTTYTVSESLRRFLGFASTSFTGSGTQTAANKGQGHLDVWGIKVNAPRPIEEVSFREYRHGRALAFTGNYGDVSRVEVFLDAADLDTLLAGPLLSAGRVRLYPDYAVTGIDDPFEADIPGGYVDVTPLEVVNVQRFGLDDSQAIVAVECAWEL